jgi:hypothetical protein
MAIQVPIEFVTQFGKALDGVEQFTKSVDKSVGGIENSFSQLKKVAGAFVAAFAVDKIIDGLQAVAAESSEAEIAARGLENALKASGDFSLQNVEAFQDLADELARVSKFEDDVILGTVKLAKSFNLTNDEAAELIKAAVDLSAVTGDDLNSSVKALGQTFDGTAGRLAQVVPQLQGLTAEQLRNGEAVKIVAERYKGFAENELKGYDGALIQLAKSQKDFQEELGVAVTQNEAVLIVLTSVKDIFIDLAAAVGENRKEFGELIRGGLILFVDSMGIAVQVTDTVIRFFSILGSQLKLLANLFGAVGLAVKGELTASFEAGRDAIATYKNDMIEIGKTSAGFDKVTERIAGVSVALENATVAQNEIVKTTEKVTKGFDKQTNAVERFNSQLKSDFETLEKSLQDVGKTQADTIKNVFEKNLNLINSAKRQGFITDVEREKLLGNLKIKFTEDNIKLQKESYDKLVQQLQQLQQNPFSSALGDGQVPSRGGRAGLSDGQSQGLARGIGGLSQVLNGAEGAKNLIGQAAGAAGTALFGPAGAALGPLVETLSQGPEKVGQLIDEFSNAIPVIIENVVLALPVVIERLAENLPVIIEKLVEALPRVIEALIEALPQVIEALVLMMPKIINALVKGSAQIVAKWVSGAGQFVGKIIEGAFKFVGKIIAGAGEFVKKILSKVTGGLVGGKSGGLFGGKIIKGFLKSGSGGTDEESGFVPSGRDLSFGKAGGGSSGDGSPMQVNLVIGNRQLAQAVFDVNKLGYRTAPT